MLSNRAAGGKSRTRILPLKPLGFLTFWLLDEISEDCMCGTIPQSRATFMGNLDSQAVRTAGSAPTGSPVPGTNPSAIRLVRQQLKSAHREFRKLDRATDGDTSSRQAHAHH